MALGDGGATVPRKRLHHLSVMFRAMSMLRPRGDPTAIAAVMFREMGQMTFTQKYLYDGGVSTDIVVDRMMRIIHHSCSRQDAESVREKCTEICRRGGTGKKYWGSRVWAMLHHYADLATEQHRPRVFYCIVACVCQLLPCAECKGHCQRHLSKTGQEILSTGPGDGPREWMSRFHDAVNERLTYQ